MQNDEAVKELVEAVEDVDAFLNTAGVSHIAAFSDKWLRVRAALRQLDRTGENNVPRLIVW